ncbi:DUF1651 domain-containing protein [Prochlorococcus sp. MIT 1223]|uniref:DUF1651 domain-containing protein n=1 Tax=Prochlorococcus sp. MIT 1223 TaxID=3096217 RepID=UPI002A75AF2B|nr:DUF1651 domain-containing protein [Prochlorococcus sp. MIT 1223]
MILEGWLIDPSKTLLLRFHKDPTSLQRLPQIYMDKWSVTTSGTPCSLINRRKVHFDPALETWNELVLNGWEELRQQFSEAA